MKTKQCLCEQVEGDNPQCQFHSAKEKPCPVCGQRTFYTDEEIAKAIEAWLQANKK